MDWTAAAQCHTGTNLKQLESAYLTDLDGLSSHELDYELD